MVPAAPGRLMGSFGCILSDFLSQKWSGWLRTTLRIHLDQVQAKRSILDRIRAIFNDLGPNRHCGPDLHLQDQARDGPLEWVGPVFLDHTGTLVNRGIGPGLRLGPILDQPWADFGTTLGRILDDFWQVV